MTNKMPYEDCPSFNACSAPRCPLDPDISIRVGTLPGEEKCRAHKPTREKIGKQYPALLPYGGLTKREFNGRKRWDELTPAKKQASLARLSSFGVPSRKGKA